MHTKNTGRFAVDEDFLQFRTAPKMMMGRKRNWAENETDLKTKIPKTKLVQNWQICSFGAENENEIRSVSNWQGSLAPLRDRKSNGSIVILLESKDFWPPVSMSATDLAPLWENTI